MEGRVSLQGLFGADDGAEIKRGRGKRCAGDVGFGLMDGTLKREEGENGVEQGLVEVHQKGEGTFVERTEIVRIVFEIGTRLVG